MKISSPPVSDSRSHNYEGVSIKTEAPEGSVHLPVPFGRSGSFSYGVDRLDFDLTNIINKNKPVIVGKIVLVFALLIGHFLRSRNFPVSRPAVECLHDMGFELTSSVNDELNRNKGLLTTFELTSSTLVDFTSVSLMYYFYKRGTTIRYPVQLIGFYAMRGFIQSIFLFRFPEKGVWDHPGIPSLSVPYGLTNDFYYSGHCGFMVMMSMEHFKMGNKKLPIFLLISVFYVAFVLISTRIHYTIDIPIGMLTGYYAHYLTNYFIRHIQALMRRIFNRCCWLKMKYFAEV
jgi:PAP2 superfamily C-terminal